MAASVENNNASPERKEYSNMNGSNIMQGWLTLVGSLAIIAVVLTAFGIMIGIVKPADALKRIGTIIGIEIFFLLVPGIIAGVWSVMSLWQQIAFIVIGIGAFQLLRPRRRARKRNVE
jgi:hypothetical protein